MTFDLGKQIKLKDIADRFAEDDPNGAIPRLAKAFDEIEQENKMTPKPKEHAWPPRIEQMKEWGSSEMVEYISASEATHLIAVAKAEAFEEAAGIVSGYLELEGDTAKTWEYINKKAAHYRQLASAKENKDE